MGVWVEDVLSGGGGKLEVLSLTSTEQLVKCGGEGILRGLQLNLKNVSNAVDIQKCHVC